MDHSFEKKLVLTHKVDIDVLFADGKREKSHPFVVLHMDQSPINEIPFKLLISVPKRNFKRAVDRNYLKRCIREIVRTNKGLMPSYVDRTIAIAILYSFKNKLSFLELKKSLTNALNQIHF